MTDLSKEQIPQSVKRRVVFYIPGFDPMPPNRYRELYSAEAKKQAEVSGFDIDVARISSLDGVPRFKARANIDGAEVQSEFRFLKWNDLVHQNMQGPIWKSWLGMIQVAKVLAFSGALRGVLKLHYPPNVAGLYPFLMIPFQILASLLLAIAIAYPVWGLSFPLAPLIAVIIGVIIFWLAVNFGRKVDGKLMAYYLLHDLMFTCQEGGYTPAPLQERFEVFKSSIKETMTEDFDEVLVVGHSSGVHLGVMVLAELYSQGAVKTSHNVSFLSLGHAVPMVSYLPKASDLRAALKILSCQDVIKWVDVTAPSDGACFALHSPVTSSIPKDESQLMPKVVSAAFRQSLSDDYYRAIRMRFFRLHFQYLCHFDRPSFYDYFEITSGPQRLWERFEEKNNSPSQLDGNFNPFHDEDHTQFEAA